MIIYFLRELVKKLTHGPWLPNAFKNWMPIGMVKLPNKNLLKDC